MVSECSKCGTEIELKHEWDRIVTCPKCGHKMRETADEVWDGEGDWLEWELEEIYD